MLNLRKLLLFSTVLVILLGFSTISAYADESKTGTVTASTVNLRKSASTSSSIITTLDKGAKLTILKTSSSWSNVKTASGKTGWVLSKYVSTKGTATTQAAISKKATVTSTTLNLRKSASTSSSVVYTLKKGQVLSILRASNGWYNVKASNGKIGWVNSKYVEVKSSATINRGDITREPVKEQPKADAKTETSDAADLGTAIVSYAKNFLGVKYVYGGMSPEGFDCSGFVKYVFDHFNINIDRVSTDQATQGVEVNRADLRPGDLVFFDTNGGHNRVNHAGIYIGEGYFIQASSGSSTGKVVISNLASGFYDESFMIARRLF